MVRPVTSSSWVPWGRDTQAQLARHMTGALVIGSKMHTHCPYHPGQLAHASDLGRLYEALRSHVDDMAVADPYGPWRVSVTTEEPAGHNALMARDTAKALGLPLVSFVRDPGTSYERLCQAALLPADAHAPSTHEVHMVGGAYGATGAAGPYAVFVGDSTPPFPAPTMRPDALEEAQHYWNTHVFLADAEELMATLVRENIHRLSSAMTPAQYQRHQADILAKAEALVDDDYPFLRDMRSEVRMRKYVEAKLLAHTKIMNQEFDRLSIDRQTVLLEEEVVINNMLTLTGVRRDLGIDVAALQPRQVRAAKFH